MRACMLDKYVITSFAKKEYKVYFKIWLANACTMRSMCMYTLYVYSTENA